MLIWKWKLTVAYIYRRCGQLGLCEPANDPLRIEAPTPIFFTKSTLLLNPLSNQNRAHVAIETHCFGGIAGESYFNCTPPACNLKQIWDLLISFSCIGKSSSQWDVCLRWRKTGLLRRKTGGSCSQPKSLFHHHFCHHHHNQYPFGLFELVSPIRDAVLYSWMNRD